MSCKEKVNPSKSKHYTSMERKVFLQTLERYKHIIEVKKSDGTTLKEKDVAWNEICTTYNQSTLICQERTVQQLKKLWTNLKQSQREALTKEKQSRMATGRGSQEIEANIDPDISNIAPHLMKTAPVLFTSNMTEAEVNNQRELAFEIVSNDNMELLDIEDAISVTNTKNIIENTSWQDTSTIASKNTKESISSCNSDISEVSLNTLNTEKIETKSKMKRKRKETLELLEMEEKLKIERIKRIITEEEKVANIKLKHEETIAKIKEEHLREINNMQLQHLKEIQKIEVCINKAKLLNVECQTKENIDPRI